MKKFIISSYCFVLACVLISLVAIPLMRNHHTTESTAKIPEIEIPTKSVSYIVKDFNGNIAVFEENADTPLKVTEVCTNTLPRVDQDRLAEGITVSTRAELNTLLEDLCS